MNNADNLRRDLQSTKAKLAAEKTTQRKTTKTERLKTEHQEQQ